MSSKCKFDTPNWPDNKNWSIVKFYGFLNNKVTIKLLPINLWVVKSYRWDDCKKEKNPLQTVFIAVKALTGLPVLGFCFADSILRKRILKLEKTTKNDNTLWILVLKGVQKLHFFSSLETWKTHSLTALSECVLQLRHCVSFFSRLVGNQ